MKKTSIISLLIGCIAFGSMTTSCEDMLSPDSERHSYEVAQDTLYSYWGIIKSWQNIAERYIVLGECRGELVSATSHASDSITAILNFDMSEATDGSCRYLKASDYYHVINSCNAYLANCDRERTTGTLQPYMLKEAAQVEAIRAWTYLQLVQVYGEVPFYTDPLLTTDEIDKFMANHPTATIDNLADLLAPSLKEAQKVEMKYGMPQYDTYQNVCHSSKVMIPLNLIIADLYLAKGDKASCLEAAQYYYDYLSNNQGLGNVVPGGALPITYHYGYQTEGMERPVYSYTVSSSTTSLAPWAQTSAVTATSEAVTAIPSSTNKLWGTVLRGVNNLYGYDSEIRVRTENTSDTTSATNATITLSAQYDVKQLAASQAYFDLCKAQKFELIISANSTAATTTDSVTIDPAIGDARQYWVRDVDQTYSNGMNSTEKFIKKINPQGSDLHPSFSTVSHMIYRKSMIWLRFAEALNGAGYPSYAFAILKNGLCNNDNWFPEAEPAIRNNVFSVDYAVTDTAWVFFAAGDSLLYPGAISIKGKPREETLKEYIYKMVKEGKLSTAKTNEADLDSFLVDCVNDSVLTDSLVKAGTSLWVPAKFQNYPDENCKQVLYYIDRREAMRNPSFLNFKFESLDGNASSWSFMYRSSLTDRSMPQFAIQPISGDSKVTFGIHSHGGGILRYNEKTSSFNYVDKVAEKAKDYGYTLTKDDIYSGNYDDVVQKCVEDLIVDEEALELAFEGTRFFDLLRVAHRRSDPSYLANRLALRDPSLAGKLMNPKNWYFPLPQ